MDAIKTSGENFWNHDNASSLPEDLSIPEMGNDLYEKKPGLDCHLCELLMNFDLPDTVFVEQTLSRALRCFLVDNSKALFITGSMAYCLRFWKLRFPRESYHERTQKLVCNFLLRKKKTVSSESRTLFTVL